VAVLPSRAEKDLTRSPPRAQRFEYIGGTRRQPGILPGRTWVSLSIDLRLTEMRCRLIVLRKAFEIGNPGKF